MDRSADPEGLTKLRADSPPGAAEGLSDAEATRRLAQFGENTLAEHRVGVIERLAHFFWGPIPWMIEVAAILSGLLRHWDDLSIILAMLFINAGVGFWQEYKADNAIELLKRRLALQARVRSILDRHHVDATIAWTLGAEPFLTPPGTLSQALKARTEI